MKKKRIVGIGLITLIIICGIVFNLCTSDYKDKNMEVSEINAKVLKSENNEITIQDSNNVIYTFNANNMDVEVGSNVFIEYTGLLNKDIEIQNIVVVDYEIIKNENESNIPDEWQDNGIFNDYYSLAYNKIKQMSLEEKIGQILLVRYPDDETASYELKKYKFGGYVFFGKDFQDKTKQEVINMIDKLQEVSEIPILTAVDEEGGTVVRVSSNPNLSANKFLSSQELYKTGGFNLIREDTIKKSNLLKSLGLNLNLAPVVDVSTNSSDYMYSRSLGEDTATTSLYAYNVIDASKGSSVSYTLKHFPGYGNNSDTHTESSVDDRSYDDIISNDLPPFETGINAGAEAVLVSHNIVSSIDSNNPASLSASIHNLLRNRLNFTGIIITDDLDMGAVSSIDDAIVQAILAGNDLIITTDYENDINKIKSAINNGIISEDVIDKLAFRVIAWKYYKGMMFNNEK